VGNSKLYLQWPHHKGAVMSLAAKLTENQMLGWFQHKRQYHYSKSKEKIDVHVIAWLTKVVTPFTCVDTYMCTCVLRIGWLF